MSCVRRSVSAPHISTNTFQGTFTDPEISIDWDTSEAQRPEAVWSGPHPFVGRADIMEALLAEVDAAVEEGGRTVFLLGPSGSGKTATIGMFQEYAFRRHRQLRAEYVDCAHSGTKTWIELAELFTRRHQLGEMARRLAGEWFEVVPIVGKLLAAVSRTIEAMRTGRIARRRQDLAQSDTESAVAAVRTLLEYGPLEPRVLIMDSLDRGDAEDLAGASALIRHIEKTRTLFLAAVRTSKGRPPDSVRDLVLEAERLGRTRIVKLGGLKAEELRAALHEATRREVPPPLLDWVRRETRGNPRELWDLLGSLEREGHLKKTGRRWVWDGSLPERAPSDSEPSGVEDGETTDVDRRLLAIAAVEGPVFHSAVLAELAGISELEAEDHLSTLCRSGIIDYRGAPAVGDDVTSEYSFQNAAEAEGYAAQLSEKQRTELRQRARELRRRLDLPDSSGNQD